MPNYGGTAAFRKIQHLRARAAYSCLALRPSIWSNKHMTTFNISDIRTQFPALERTVNGQPALYFDGPGGTQVPTAVIDAMSDFMRRGGANLAPFFAAGAETIATVQAAREAMRDLLNARRAEEIVFGQNMTSLTFHLSRALSKTWEAGDEIILTRIDHDANVSPWLLAAEERGVTVRWLDFQPHDCTLKIETLPDLLNERTRLIAIAYASNAVGSISDINKVVEIAHTAGVKVFVDAVHYAPHDIIDVQATDCDFLACSVYKFFGPHTGVLYGKYALLDQLDTFKVRPAPAVPPGKWETGTQSFESLAGVAAAVNYLASLGEGAMRREQLVSAFTNIKQHEMALSEQFLRESTTVEGLRVYGITDIERLDERTPTFAVSLEGITPSDLAARLGEQGIFVYAGHYYAVEVMRRLDLLESGGLVRIGFVHYNDSAEISRLIRTLKNIR